MPAMSFEKSDLSVTFSFADGDKTFALPAFDLEQGKIKSIDYSIKDAEEFTGNTPGEDAPAKPANNEIWYTNGSTTWATTPTNPDFGANIVSNTYDADKECWVIKFDSDVTKIGYSAFYERSNLTSITIGDSVTSIEDEAFNGCSSLTSVTIGDSVTSIGWGAFARCSLTNITIPDSVTTIGVVAFSGCWCLQEFNGKFASEDGRCLIVDGILNSIAPAGLTEYTIPNSVTTIGDYAFEGCSSLTSVTIPDSVTTIGNTAFYNCSSLTSITIGDSVTTIGHHAFYSCTSLTSLTIGDSVTTIGKSAFYGCSSLTSITIPDSVTTIGDEAFCGCSSLTSVTIGDSVTSIGNYAFEYCKSLTSVYCKAVTPPAGGNDMFYSIASSGKIYVPTESVEAYKSATGWSQYAFGIVGYDF